MKNKDSPLLGIIGPNDYVAIFPQIFGKLYEIPKEAYNFSKIFFKK